MALGRKTGGRQKGVHNKPRQTVFDIVHAKGKDPIDVLCDLMINSLDENIKIMAAREVAQYIHTKRPRDLNISGDIELNLKFAERLKEVQALPIAEKLLRIEAAKKKIGQE